MTYLAEALADSPRAGWLLEETSGTTAADVTGNSRPLTYSSAVLGGPAIYNGGAGSVKGGASGQGIGTVAYDGAWMSPTTFTVAGWFVPTTTTDIVGLMSQFTSGGWAVWQRRNKIGLVTYGSTQQEADGPLIAVNKPRHIAVRLSAGVMDLFVDGTKRVTITLTGSFTSAMGALQVGGYSGSNYSRARGAGLFYYNTALSDARIAAHFAAGAMHDTTPKAHWKLDETSGTTMADSSGAGRDGTYSGAILGQSPLRGSGYAAKGGTTGQGVASLATAAESVFDVGEFTIAANIQPANTSTFKGLITRWNGAGWMLWQYSGTISLYVDNASLNTVYSGPTISVGVQHRFALTVESGIAKLYVDGVLTHTWTLTFALPSNAFPVQIGGYGGAANYSEAVFDDVKFWDVALTADEVATEFVGVVTTTAVAASDLPGLDGASTVVVPAAGTALAGLPSLDGLGFVDVPTAAVAVVGSDLPALGALGLVEVPQSPAVDVSVTLPGLDGAASAEVPVVAAADGTLPVLEAVGTFLPSSSVVLVEGHLPMFGATAAVVSAAVPASGWDADLTGQALAGVTTTPAELYVPPVVVEPPAGVRVATLVRNSHLMPPLSAAKRRYREDEYEVLDQASLGAAALVGVPHVWINGVDRTYDVDGQLVDVDDLATELGLGDRSARANIRRIQLWERPGEGDRAWLRPAAKVEVGVVRPDGTRKVWFAGDLISDDAESVAGTSPKFSSSWAVQGTLVQAMQANMQPLDEMDSTDIGIVIPRVLNAVVSRRFPRVPTMHVGIPTKKLGSYGQKVGDYVRTLLATAWVGDSQLRLVPDPTNRRQYRLAWTDTTTVHWNLTAGAKGIGAKLGEDWSQVTNVIYGRGTKSNGHRWFNRRFPYLLPYTPPGYFSNDTSDELLLGSTDADTINNGVSLYTQRLRELGHKVPLSSVMLAVHVTATRRLQHARGLLVDGRVGGQTWTSVWSIGATGADLRSVRLPLWADPRVEPWLYLPNGAIAGPNLAYDPSWPRIEDDIDYGDNTSLEVGIADATQRGERLKEPGLVGTVTMGTDFWEGSRFEAEPGENVKLWGWRGSDPMLHIAGRTIKLAAGQVELTVDSKFRDALTVREIIKRNAESRPDPARRPGAIGRTSSTVAQDFTIFDGDSAAGIVPELTIRGGLWSVWPFPLDRAGTLAKAWAQTFDPATRFAMLLFGDEVLPAQLAAALGNPLGKSRPWTDPAVDAWLTRKGFIAGWGQAGEACGYYPGSQQDGDPVTGEFSTEQAVSFVSRRKGFAWMAVIPAADCRIRAEFDPQAKG